MINAADSLFRPAAASGTIRFNLSVTNCIAGYLQLDNHILWKNTLTALENLLCVFFSLNNCNSVHMSKWLVKCNYILVKVINFFYPCLLNRAFCKNCSSNVNLIIVIPESSFLLFSVPSLACSMLVIVHVLLLKSLASVFPRRDFKLNGKPTLTN